MSIHVDSATYDKAANYPPGHGYEMRRGQPTSVVVHSTSNIRKDTAFAGEAKFLFESADVSAHYLIGKSGAIIQMLEPGPWAAWHAGQALPSWVNQRSVGIELHHSVGDPPYPKAQIGALTWLTRDLMSVFVIAPAAVETHGQIALPGPYQRKHDPADWSHGDFLTWRSALSNPPAAGTGTYRAITGCPIFEAPRGAARLALAGRAVLLVGNVVEVDSITNEYAHLGASSPTMADTGFVPLGVLERT